jgi:hypothetical protein
MSTLASQRKGPPFCYEDVKSTLIKQARGSWETAGFVKVEDYLKGAEVNGVVNLCVNKSDSTLVSPGRNVRSWITYL